MDDLEGKVIGRLTVVERAPPPPNVRPAKDAYWRCTCTCGREKVVRATILRAGRTKSCGCLTEERRRHRQKGADSKHPLYSTWVNIKHRCENPKVPQYARYGGRGIRLCERWQLFGNFVQDVGDRPTPRHSIDRIDNDGNYEPGNVRWALPSQQTANRRPHAAITLYGEKMTVAEAAERLGTTEESLRGLAWMSLQEVVDRLARCRKPPST